MKHGEFILLQDGRAICYASDFDTTIERLNQQYEKHPASEFIITQVVGTVDKPKVPVVHSVYGANNLTLRGQRER
jgi:hypothetical protein